MLRLYNTLGKKIELFAPRNPPTVKVYACGPTVYHFQHIGNMRKYIVDDVLHRVLVRTGYRVQHVINITDVGHLTQDDIDQGEDKLLVAARREHKTPRQIADFYTEAFVADSRLLNLTPPTLYARATEHIPEMIEHVRKLVQHGVAYVVNGNVYFDVASFKHYGKLSGNTLEMLRSGVRPEIKQAAMAEKKNPADFALWKKAEAGHLLQWPSPWGAGYPGWHIECAAMIFKHLGHSIDIHTGGEDHIFPHHEDEIAEAEVLTDEPLARYWLHVRFLKWSGKKMAKRQGEIIRVTDLVKKGFHPLAFRYLCLQAQFTSSLEFTWEAMQAAQEGWGRLQDVVARLRETGVAGRTTDPVPSEVRQQLDDLDRHFDSALADNLGTPRALAVLSDLLVLANTLLAKQPQSATTLNTVLEQILHFDEVLGLLPAGGVEAAAELPENELAWLTAQLKSRQALRAKGDYAGADRVRREMEGKGFEVSDTPGGVRWKKTSTGQRGMLKD